MGHCKGQITEGRRGKLALDKRPYSLRSSHNFASLRLVLTDSLCTPTSQRDKDPQTENPHLIFSLDQSILRDLIKPLQHIYLHLHRTRACAFTPTDIVQYAIDSLLGVVAGDGGLGVSEEEGVSL